MFDDTLREGFAGLVEAVRRVRPTLPVDAHEAIAFSVWALAHGVVGLVVDGTAKALRGKRSGPRVFEATARHAVALARGG